MRWLAIITALALPLPGHAACRLGLMLALDVSASVDAREYGLQTGGIASALLAPEVADAILAAPDQPVWLSVFDWSGPFDQSILLAWTPLRTRADLEGAAAAIAGAHRMTRSGRTAVGAALGFAGRLFASGPGCTRLTLDVSGDGANNIGDEPFFAREAQNLEGVTINGLAIGGLLPLDIEPFTPYRGTLRDWFETQLIKGPGAFVITAESYDDYAEAMRRKLFREVGGMLIGEAN